MGDLVFTLAGEHGPRDRLPLLLARFSKRSDERSTRRVMSPLAEVLLLLPRATICSCDDFGEIAAWARAISPFRAASPSTSSAPTRPMAPGPWLW